VSVITALCRKIERPSEYRPCREFQGIPAARTIDLVLQIGASAYMNFLSGRRGCQAGSEKTGTWQGRGAVAVTKFCLIALIAVAIVGLRRRKRAE
jgi:hypothetical protein